MTNHSNSHNRNHPDHRNHRSAPKQSGLLENPLSYHYREDISNNETWQSAS